jgi:N-acetylglutamate synthase-like GNAT family acetyltransferase
MDPTIKIRNVKAVDAPGILKIARELGYPASEKTIKDLIKLVTQKNDQQIIIAENDLGLIGYIHVHTLAENDVVRTEVSGILLPESSRNKGIGSQFLKEAEKWSKNRDIKSICIKTTLIRSEAIAFFKYHGFRLEPAKDIFTKQLI